jgi:outer membrane protein OmpA-like peptidoglycan-associated protein
MNSKPLILAAFALWCFVCARWYVCGIKGACVERPVIEEVIQTPEQPASAVPGNPEIQPIAGGGNNPPDNTSSNTVSAKPVTPENMDNVQMETVQDRMVIHFPYQSTRKEDNAAIDSYLNGLAQQLIASGEKVYITGHTDFVGESNVNYYYGTQRAKGIRDILVKKGVPKSQIICKSYGEKKPVATNDNAYGRYLNRRAEIRVGK